MTKHCLVYCISPIHLISSVCAIRTLHDTNEIEVTIIVHWPGFSQEENNEIFNIVSKFSRNFKFIKKIISLDQKELDYYTNNSLKEINDKFKKKFNYVEYQEIYYSHDVTGILYQLLCSIYPHAERICFGDALGMVFEKKVHLSFLQEPRVSLPINKIIKQKITLLLKNIYKLFKKSSIEQLANKVYFPQKAALILPVDQSGNFLKKVDLRICDKSIFIDTLEECINSANDLNDYIIQLLQDYKSKKITILLTENIAEGNFIDFETEIEMWCSIIRQNCKNDVIFLKSHPGERLPRNKRIIERVGNEFEIVELDKKYKRCPIEIWKNLILKCHHIVCMSYPTLSLKYIYNIDVIQPMNETFIEQWFPKWTWNSYKNSMSLYKEPLKKLKEWDGKSILWSGNIRYKSYEK